MSATPALTVGGYDVSKSLLLDLTKIRAPYDDIPVENAYTGKKLEHDWTLHLISDDSRTGYDGALFSAEVDGQPHYFIYHQGSNNVKDIPSAARLARGKLPQQTEEAKNFTKEAMDYIRHRHPDQDVPVVQVGYSIGAVMAMLTAEDNQPILTFEGPGCKKLLTNYGYDVEEIGSRTVEILSPHPNVINSHEAHVGDIIEAGEKFWKTDKASVIDFLRMTGQTHHIRNIGLALAGMDDFSATPAKESTRPTEAMDALGEYLDDYVGKDSSLRERILASTVDMMDVLGIDKFVTAIAIFGADLIAGKLSEEFIERNAVQAYRRPQTHPDVHKPQLERTQKVSVATPETKRENTREQATPDTASEMLAGSASQPTPQATSFAASVLAEREKSATATVQR